MLTPDKIIQLCADEYRTTPEEIKGKTRSHIIFLARYSSVYIIMQEFHLTQQQIAKKFNRSQPTITRGVKKFETYQRTIPALRKRFKYFYNSIKLGDIM